MKLKPETASRLTDLTNALSFTYMKRGKKSRDFLNLVSEAQVFVNGVYNNMVDMLDKVPRDQWDTPLHDKLYIWADAWDVILVGEDAIDTLFDLPREVGDLKYG